MILKKLKILVAVLWRVIELNGSSCMLLILGQSTQ